MRITANTLDEELTEYDENFENPDVYTINDVSHISEEKEPQPCQKVQEVTQKLRDLTLSEPSTSSNLGIFTVVATQAAERLQMEKASEDKSTPGVPPPWLLQYLLKMKNEIKQEVVEELMTVTHVEMRSDKVHSAAKSEEFQLHFQGEVIHDGVFCDNCDQLIHGIRYKCGNCSNFDLCQECESLPNVHNKTHIFLKIRYPVALKLYQRQKWQELVSPSCRKIYSLSGKSRHPSKKLYEAKFVCDETVPDSTVLPPATGFVKSWKVVNSGTRVWTHSTKLHLIQGSVDLIPRNDHVDVPHLRPGEEGIVSVHFTSPSSPGVFRSHWNFCQKSRPFGDIVWCHIVVKEPNQESTQAGHETKLGNRVKLQVNSQSEKVLENKQSEISCVAQVLAAVKERENLSVPRKLAVSSHTATPNNTPFDLSPPKSPDHHETAIKEIHHLKSGNLSAKAIDSDNDDECSIVSLSSDSETEFVVIPMPKCFNLSESFIAPPNVDLATLPDFDQDAVNETLIDFHFEKPAPSHKTPNTGNSRHSNPLKTVSQETGVPELSDNSYEQTVIQVTERNTARTSSLTIITDDSSSEVSIIESGDSPTAENGNTVDSINITMTTDETGTDQAEDRLEVKLVNTNMAEQENEERASDIPNSATFPKFPLEVVMSAFDPTPSCNEERTVPVLPESLMTGALSAAATVYNTARDIISTIHNPRVQQGHLSQSPVSPIAINGQSTGFNQMDQLVEMGFSNRQQNDQLLRKHRGDLPRVVADLVNMSDNDWYASRHNPPSPSFD